MPSPAEISGAGPWAVLAFFLASATVALWIAFVKRVIVPGWLYDRSEARAEKAEQAAAVAQSQADRNAQALQTLADVVGRRDSRGA